jgi:site-specific recombinase XerC
MRIGNWLTAEQGKHLLAVFDHDSLRGKPDYAMVAVLLGCGLRRAEVAGLAVERLQQREEHWVIADMVGKGGHVRTVPVPTWVKAPLRSLFLAGNDVTPEAGGRGPPKAVVFSRSGCRPPK